MSRLLSLHLKSHSTFVLVACGIYLTLLIAICVIVFDHGSKYDVFGEILPLERTIPQIDSNTNGKPRPPNIVFILTDDQVKSCCLLKFI